MTPVAESIMTLTSGCSEGTPLVAKMFLHLGSRASVDQALSRLKRRGLLLRIGRGLYVRPVETRFGVRPPSVPSVVQGVARLMGEKLEPHGAATANALGLTTQVPVRPVYVTSGRSRRLKLGTQEVELQHAPRWQFASPHESTGQVIRALAWLGAEEGSKKLPLLRQKLSRHQRQELAAANVLLPTWLATQVSTLANG